MPLELQVQNIMDIQYITILSFAICLVLKADNFAHDRSIKLGQGQFSIGHAGHSDAKPNCRLTKHNRLVVTMGLTVFQNSHKSFLLIYK